MIKFDTQLGAKHLNMEARQHKELMQSQLKGMRCMKCTGVDTTISFHEETMTGALPSVKVSFLKHQVIACCDDFKQRITEKLMEQPSNIKR